ncbi:Zinc finger protein unc-98 [Globodera pallida]|nr:Zinc finger protein unc-98 [Globodera pallida]
MENVLSTKASEEKDAESGKVLVECKQDVGLIADKSIDESKNQEKIEAETEKFAKLKLTKPEDATDELKEVGCSSDQQKNVIEKDMEEEAPPMSASGCRSLKWVDDAQSDKGEHPPVEQPTCKTQKVRSDSCKDQNGFTYYKCRFCGLTFNYMTTLKAHERVHDITQPYLCNKCGESFHYMCELEYHAKTHLQQKGYKCECGRTFFQYTDLLYHKHPGEDEPYPSVPVPSASVTDIGPLVTSSPSIHPAEFPTPEFAEQGFEPKYQLKRGLSDVRSKPYICQYCSKSYADSRGLAYHMYSHRGERVFNPRASRYLMCRNDNSYISPGLDLRDA